MLTISGTLEDLMRDLPALVATGVEVQVAVTVKEVAPCAGSYVDKDGRLRTSFYFTQNWEPGFPGAIPAEVWCHMRDQQHWGNSVDCLTYDKADDALQALSDGFVRWAKAVAEADKDQ